LNLKKKAPSPEEVGLGAPKEGISLKTRGKEAD